MNHIVTAPKAHRRIDGTQEENFNEVYFGSDWVLCSIMRIEVEEQIHEMPFTPLRPMVAQSSVLSSARLREIFHLHQQRTSNLLYRLRRVQQSRLDCGTLPDDIPTSSSACCAQG